MTTKFHSFIKAIQNINVRGRFFFHAGFSRGYLLIAQHLHLYIYRSDKVSQLTQQKTEIPH